eukprot:15481896-Alexandrium_andersonii.AAC.1
MAPPGPSSSSALARCSPLGAGVAAGRGTTAPAASPLRRPRLLRLRRRCRSVGGRSRLTVGGSGWSWWRGGRR